MKKIIFAFLLMAGSTVSAQVCDSVAIWANESSNAVCIEIAGNIRYFYSNSMPDHSTGTFPNAGNPHTISAQDYSYTTCAYPAQNDSMTIIYSEIAGGPGICPADYIFGMAVNGLKLDPSAAEFFIDTAGQQVRSWRLEAVGSSLGLDTNDAHVQPTGDYHYHGVPTGLLVNLGALTSGSHSPIVGWAADGFPVYYKYVYSNAMDSSSGINPVSSCWQLKTGMRPGDGITAPNGTYDGTYVQDYELGTGICALDTASGRFGVTPDFPSGTYYYVITDNWPYIPRHFRGHADGSFKLGPPFCTGSTTNSCLPPTSRESDLRAEMQQVLVFPNPTQDFLNISFNGISPALGLDLYLFNMEGKEIRRELSSDGILEISDLTPAVYYLQIKSGNISSTIKVVKK